MILSKEKTKSLTYNLWYHLWKNPSCEYEDDLEFCGEDAKKAYDNVKYYPACSPCCEYDYQMRLMKRKKGHKKVYEVCHFCPLLGENNLCCSGDLQKWVVSDNEQLRKKYAESIMKQISVWKL